MGAYEAGAKKRAGAGTAGGPVFEQMEARLLLSTIYATSPAEAAVTAAMNAAKTGDTVSVPAGTATWASQLVITKGIYLIGAGGDNTTITNNYSGSFLIVYQPSDFAANNPFRLSGFAFNLADKSSGIQLDHTKSSSLVIQTDVRVDHNHFYGMTSNALQAITNCGMRGVVDHNFFDNIPYPIRNDSCYGSGQQWWDNWEGVAFGKADNNMYYEDNVFTGVSRMLADSQMANRYVFRYNTITATADMWPLLDSHGNQGTNMYSSFGGEVYGNLVTDTGHYVEVVDQRGGKFLVFDNSIGTTLTSWIQIREEYDDSQEPTTNPQPEHVSDSYYWGSRNTSGTLVVGSILTGPTGTATGAGANYIDDTKANFSQQWGSGIYGIQITGGKGAGQFRRIISGTTTRFTVASNWSVTPDSTSQYKVIGDCSNVLAENREFFNQNTSFNGTTGIGVGTLANRPTTCTTGVAYWATDQSTTSLTGMVGANPTSPITGVLYKATATNTWTAYYVPYCYPNPLVLIEDYRPGDANLDGKVDGADLAIWQQNYDPSGKVLTDTWRTGDWNFDGKIDGSDLALWQQNYSPTSYFSVIDVGTPTAEETLMTAAGAAGDSESRMEVEGSRGETAEQLPIADGQSAIGNATAETATAGEASGALITPVAVVSAHEGQYSLSQLKWTSELSNTDVSRPASIGDSELVDALAAAKVETPFGAF